MPTHLTEKRNSTEDERDPLYLSVAEASRITGLGRTTLYQLISDGTIQSFTIGRRRLIVGESLRRLPELRPRQVPS